MDMKKTIDNREYEQTIMFNLITKLKKINPDISFVLHNNFSDFEDILDLEQLQQFSCCFGNGTPINWIIETNGDFELPFVGDNEWYEEWYNSWQNNEITSRYQSYNEKEVKEKCAELDVVEFCTGLKTDNHTYQTIIVGGVAKKMQNNKTL